MKLDCVRKHSFYIYFFYIYFVISDILHEWIALFTAAHLIS